MHCPSHNSKQTFKRLIAILRVPMMLISCWSPGYVAGKLPLDCSSSVRVLRYASRTASHVLRLKKGCLTVTALLSPISLHINGLCVREMYKSLALVPTTDLMLLKAAKIREEDDDSHDTIVHLLSALKRKRRWMLTAYATFCNAITDVSWYNCRGKTVFHLIWLTIWSGLS